MPYPLARDTAPAAEARQIAFFQQRPPAERLRITCELTAFAFASSRAAVQRLHPHLGPLARARRLDRAGAAATLETSVQAHLPCIAPFPSKDGPQKERSRQVS